MIKRLTMLLAAAALSLALVPPPTADAALDPNVKCRTKIGTGTRKLVDKVLKEKAKCFTKQMAGLIPGTVDCNDLEDPAFPGAVKIDKARSTLLNLTQRSCAGADTPQTNGYVICPTVECGGIAITGYESVASCMQCLAEAWSCDAIEQAYGTPPAPPDANQFKCQNFIGKGLRKHMVARIKQQQKCQFEEDQNNTGRNCAVIDLDTDPKGKVDKALVKMRTLVNRCDETALAALDSCGDTINDEKVCLEALAVGHADDLFGDLYTPAGTNAIFVSDQQGSPGGTGTIDDPVDTIGGGLTLADGQGLSNVFIDGGLYSESVTLVSGINLLGGFNSFTSWQRDGSQTSLFGGTTAASGPAS